MNEYVHEFSALGVTLEADRVRWEGGKLHGQLRAKCALPGARADADGILHTSDFNFSSDRAQSDRAKLLAQLARTNGDIDWFRILEEFRQQVFRTERTGDPGVDLRTVKRPEQEGHHVKIAGLIILLRHMSILFGDGGTLKSYLALYIAGMLAQMGYRVGYYDWELTEEDHRERLWRMFGDIMPEIWYVRCERPLVYEIDRLQRIQRDQKLQYVINDSIGYGCDGAPESAEAAIGYYQALRQLNVGSLCLAHINKSETGDQKPFGSVFWSNSARATWFIESVEGADGERRLALHNRKANLFPIQPPAGLVVTFDKDTTTINSADVADTPELAAKLNIRQRLHALLKGGSMALDAVAEELDERVESVRKSVRRNSKHFVLLEGGNRVGLRA